MVRRRILVRPCPPRWRRRLARAFRDAARKGSGPAGSEGPCSLGVLSLDRPLPAPVSFSSLFAGSDVLW